MSPGVRANNYYDNFRSFSHQNRFTTTGATQGRGRGLVGPAGPSDPAPVNNSSSSTRPRRKYKINSEQNRDQRLSGRRRHGVGAVANSVQGGGASSTAGGTAGSTVTAGSSNGMEGAGQPANVVFNHAPGKAFGTFSALGSFDAVGSNDVVGSFGAIGFCGAVSSFVAVSSFDAVGSFDDIGSFDANDSFGAIDSFDDIGSFYDVGSFYSVGSLCAFGSF